MRQIRNFFNQIKIWWLVLFWFTYVFSTNPICKIYVCFDLQNWQDNFRLVLTCKSTKNRSPNYGLIENNGDLLVRSAFSKSSFYLHVPPRFSDLPPALRSSGFVGKNPCRRWFMPSVRGWSVQLCDFRDPIFAQWSAEF